MNFNLMHPAEQIVLLINRVYQKGLTTTSGGNLSILVYGVPQSRTRLKRLTSSSSER